MTTGLSFKCILLIFNSHEGAAKIDYSVCICYGIVFQIVVLLQCAWRRAWKDTKDQCDEHEQPEEALQPRHGSSCTHLTWQEQVGKSPGETHI